MESQRTEGNLYCSTEDFPAVSVDGDFSTIYKRISHLFTLKLI